MMTTYLISNLARTFGLSRSTLLYYDRIGLLAPSARTAAGYRRYGKKDAHRLQRICRLRKAGLSLQDINRVLSSRGKLGKSLFQKRMRETAAAIINLKDQQRLLTSMLSRASSHGFSRPVDKKLWVEILQAAGMDERARERWHTEFECRAPDAHDEFLLSIGIPREEAAAIRSWCRAATKSALDKQGRDGENV